jgi:hypothetical protein
MKSWYHRLLYWLMPRVFASPQVIDIAHECVAEKDATRQILFGMLLRAIRDNETRLRLEPRESSVGVFGTAKGVEKELVPLNRELGSKVLAAMKALGEQSAVGSGESGVRRIPVLVGGHPVSLSLETLTHGEQEGISIGIEDHTRTAASDVGDTSIGPYTTRQQHLRQWCQLLEGRTYADEFRQELQGWAKQIGIRVDESCSTGPSRQTE